MQLRKLSALLRLDNLLAFFVVLMELFRSYPWLVWFSVLTLLSRQEVPLSLPSALVIALVSCYLTKGTLTRRWSLGKARLATLAVVIILLLLLVRLEHGAGYSLWDVNWFSTAVSQAMSMIVAFVFGCFLVWRGIVVGRENVTTGNLFRSFLKGVVGLILLIFAWVISSHIVTGQRALTALGPYVLGYFAAGLLALGICRFQSLRAGMTEDTSLLSRRWLLLLLAIVLIIVVVATVLAGSLSTELMAVIIKPLNTLLNWLFIALLYIVGYPAGVVATVLYYILRFFIQFLRNDIKPQQSDMPDFSDLQKQLKNVSPANLPENVIVALKWTVGILVAAALIYLLARALFRYRRSREDSGVREISESLWSWESFKSDLMTFLKYLLARFRKKPRIILSPPVPPLAAVLEGDEQPLDIRELYRGLLWEGNKAGLPKRTGDTPYEYKSTLEGALAGEYGSLSILTDAYVQNRYGHIPVKNEYLKSLVQLWLRIRALLRSRNT